MTLDHILGIAYNREQEDDCVGAVVPRSSFQLGIAASRYCRGAVISLQARYSIILVDIIHGAHGLYNGEGIF